MILKDLETPEFLSLMQQGGYSFVEKSSMPHKKWSFKLRQAGVVEHYIYISYANKYGTRYLSLAFGFQLRAAEEFAEKICIDRAPAIKQGWIRSKKRSDCFTAYDPNFLFSRGRPGNRTWVYDMSQWEPDQFAVGLLDQLGKKIFPLIRNVRTEEEFYNAVAREEPFSWVFVSPYFRLLQVIFIARRLELDRKKVKDDIAHARMKRIIFGQACENYDDEFDRIWQEAEPGK